MTRKQKRFAIIGVGMSFIAAAALLVLFALSNEITYFFSPSDIAELDEKPSSRIRLGGLVESGSLLKREGTEIIFVVTDNAKGVTVSYEGILPDLFREGQGVIAEGKFKPTGGVFVADTILAKHDETYMPKEVADSLKERGMWKDNK